MPGARGRKTRLGRAEAAKRKEKASLSSLLSRYSEGRRREDGGKRRAKKRFSASSVSSKRK